MHRHSSRLPSLIVALLLAVSSRESPRPRRAVQPEAAVRQPFELVEQLREDAEVAAPSELEAPPSRVIIRRDGEE
jgi:hypothetical protein